MTTFTFVDPDYVDTAVAAVPRHCDAEYTAGGTLATLTGATRHYVPVACALAGVRASVGTASGGQAIVVDVNKNGTTIYSTQANRPAIAAGANTILVGPIAAGSPTFAIGDFITVDIDQVGSGGVPGQNLTVQIYLTPLA